MKTILSRLLALVALSQMTIIAQGDPSCSVLEPTVCTPNAGNQTGTWACANNTGYCCRIKVVTKKCGTEANHTLVQYTFRWPGYNQVCRTSNLHLPCLDLEGPGDPGA